MIMFSKFSARKTPNSSNILIMQKLMDLNIEITQVELEAVFFRVDLSKYDYIELLCIALERHASFSIKALQYLIDQSRANGCLSSHNHIRGNKTPLHIAAEAKSPGLIKLLINNKASLEIQDSNGDTPLHLATQNKSLDCTRSLMGKGANPKAKNKKGLMPTPLHVAIEAKSLDDMEAFIKKGASIATVDAEGNTPLHIATQNKSLDCIRSLLDKDAKPNIKNNKGLMPTPLHVAIEEKAEADFVKFIEKGASVDAIDSEGDTPLHVASEKELLKYVRILIEKGANPQIKNNKDSVPQILLLVLQNQSLTDLTLFLDKEDTVRVGRAVNGDTPVHIAAQLGWLEGVKKLLVKDHSAYLLHIKNKKDQTPFEVYLLSEACKTKVNQDLADILSLDHIDLEELINKDAKASQEKIQFVYEHSLFSIKDKDIFAMAIKKCHMPVIEFLVNNKKIDVIGDNELLSIAIEQYLNNYKEKRTRDDDTLEVIRYLLEKGAPGEGFLPSLIKNHSLSSFDVVATLMETIFVSCGHTTEKRIETLMKELHPSHFSFGTVEVDERALYLNSNLSIWNYIAYMHYKGRIPSKEDLDRMCKVVANANLQSKDKNENTILHVVARYGKNWQHVARWLIDNHVRTNIENSKGETPLHAAITSENPDDEMVALLLEHGVDPYKKTNDIVNQTEFFSYKADQKHTDFQRHLDKYHSLQDLMHFHKTQGTIPSKKELQLNKKIHKRDEKSNFEKTDEQKNTVLHLAADGGKGWLHVVKFVLENKADIQAQSKDLNTVLHSAVLTPTPDLDIIKLLLESGADPSVVNKQGDTAQMHAQDAGLDKAIIDILDPQKIFIA